MRANDKGIHVERIGREREREKNRWQREARDSGGVENISPNGNHTPRDAGQFPPKKQLIAKTVFLLSVGIVLLGGSMVFGGFAAKCFLYCTFSV